MRCKNHSNKLAQFKCDRCHGLFCVDCITSRRVSESFTAYICVGCGGRCEPLTEKDGVSKKVKKARGPLFAKKRTEVQNKPGKISSVKEISTKPTTDFWRQLSGAVIFPLKSKGVLITFLFAAVVFGLSQPQVVEIPAIGMILSIVFITYGSVYLFRIVDDSYAGLRRAPPLLNLDYWSKAGGLLVFILLSIVMCLAPAHIYFMVTNAFDVIFAVLFGLGLFCMPMFIVRLVIAKSAKAINPLAVVVSISKTIFPYFVLCFMLAALAVLFVSLNFEFLIEHGMLGYAGSCALMVFIAFVQMHLLGIFARSYDQKIS